MALAAVLFPLFLVATSRRVRDAAPALAEEASPSERQRALVGQLLMVVCGVGPVLAGVAISFVGLVSVFLVR